MAFAGFIGQQVGSSGVRAPGALCEEPVQADRWHPPALPVAPEHQHPGRDQQQDQGPEADRLWIPGWGFFPLKIRAAFPGNPW